MPKWFPTCARRLRWCQYFFGARSRCCCIRAFAVFTHVLPHAKCTNFSMQMPRQVSKNTNQSSISRRRLAMWRGSTRLKLRNCATTKDIHRPGGIRRVAMKGERENMKLSIETEVAAAITAGFIALTAILIAQGNSEGQTGLPDASSPRNNPRVNTEITEQQYNSTLQPTLWVDAIRL